MFCTTKVKFNKTQKISCDEACDNNKNKSDNKNAISVKKLDYLVTLLVI
jgi:hypothetical protein